MPWARVAVGRGLGLGSGVLLPARVGPLRPDGNAVGKIIRERFLCLVRVLRYTVAVAVCITLLPASFLSSCEKLSSALSPPLRNSWVTDKSHKLKECSSVFRQDLVLFGIENLSWRMLKQESMTSLGRKHSWKEELLSEQSSHDKRLTDKFFTS